MSNPPSGFPMPGAPPPGGVPPGGMYYGTPPPPRGNSGCLKAFGITCLTLLVLGIIGIIALFSVLRGVIGTAKQIPAAEMDGQQIQRDIVAYQHKNGRYPRTLMSLVTDGESDGRDFHSPLDSNPSPAHVSWIYFAPGPNAAPNTPILDLPYTITVRSNSVTQHILVDLNGQVTSSQQGMAVPSPPSSNSPPSNSL